jgi:hypothetical protein
MRHGIGLQDLDRTVGDHSAAQLCLSRVYVLAVITLDAVQTDLLSKLNSPIISLLAALMPCFHPKQSCITKPSSEEISCNIQTELPVMYYREY